MAKLVRKVAMCLMAHPDDCEILAAGTLALLAKRGWQIHIVTMTPGDCGSMNLGPAKIAAVRRAEGAAAAKVIGATYHCLESRDLKVVLDAETVARGLHLTRQIAPSLVFTHSQVDYMLDHEQTAKIARTLTFGYGVPNATTGPIRAGSMLPYLYYADPIEGTDPYGQRIDATTHVDITGSMVTKTRALKAHASQRDWLMQHHGMDQYVKSMQHWAGLRGKEVGVKHAEGFRQHKGHPYPHDCVLKNQLGTLVTCTES